MGEVIQFPRNFDIHIESKLIFQDELWALGIAEYEGERILVLHDKPSRISKYFYLTDLIKEEYHAD